MRSYLALHTGTTMRADLRTDLAVARENGWDGVEILASKLRGFLADGGTVQELEQLLGDTRPLSLLNLGDVERQGATAEAALYAECEDLCQLATTAGCTWIQLLTGPVDPAGSYKGLPELSWPELRTATAANLRRICDIGAGSGLRFYLEGLTWTPVAAPGQLLEIVEEVERENLSIVVDFWHFWNAGVTAEEIAALPGERIACVHFCDALDEHGSHGDARQGGRNVWPAQGKIPLTDWVEAAQSTGFTGWWSCELLGPLFWEMDPHTLARSSHAKLEEMLAKPV
jgi:sugar phosphate isomerase/epimerase